MPWLMPDSWLGSGPFHLWDETIDLFRRFGSKKDLAGVLNNAGYVAMADSADWEKARPWLIEAVDLFREIEDPLGLWATLDSYAMLSFAGDNDPARALELEEEALHWGRQLNSTEAVSNALRNLGAYRRHAGDLDGAAQALAEARREESKLGPMFAGAGLTQMFAASVDLDRGEVGVAAFHLLGFNDIIRPLRQDEVLWGDRRRPLLEWARVAIALKKPDVAAALLATNEQHSKTYLDPTWPPYRAELEQTLNIAREHLDERRFESAWAEGLGMTADEALDYAVAELASLATLRDESL